MMSIRPEVFPFVVVILIIAALLVLLCVYLGMAWSGAVVSGAAFAVFFTCYFLYFFRDPERVPPEDESSIVAGADGIIMRITELREDNLLKADVVRISIFLNLFDVHVNRSPISGTVRFLDYFPGKRFFTFQEKSSEFNEHSSILVEGKTTKCLINQIAGPVCRRVVYWLTLGQELKKGDRIGMMKFGSRLDMYFPKADVTVVAGKGDRVRAGETVIAKLCGEEKL